MPKYYKNYKDYTNARDMAWQILVDHNVTELPIDITKLCKDMGIAVQSYKAAAPLLRAMGLSEQANAYDGFAIMLDEEPTIFYNAERLYELGRFTIAHEVGHLVLGHTMKPAQHGVLVSGPNQEPSHTKSPKEVQANRVAARLLAPACVLWGLGVKTAGEIKQLCGISDDAAQYRMARMRILYKQNKFLKSSLEREVFEQFSLFIRASK